MARSDKHIYFSVASVVLFCIGLGILFGLPLGLGMFAILLGIGCGFVAIDASKDNDKS